FFFQAVVGIRVRNVTGVQTCALPICPQGDADDIWAVLEDNPLTDGSLPALGSCDLPETPVEHSAEELQAVLDAAGDCLNQLWATASSDRGLPWHSPEIVVYSWPDVPTSSCEEDTF